MAAPTPRRVPLSSYRLQLSPAFTLFDAAELVPYLADLGITECYISPILAASPGSAHSYDVCDHGRISDELGGPEGLAVFAAAAKARDLGILLDFVPNHMSTNARANRWWRSVLENGPSSPYAGYFDIDWEPVKPELKGKILLPLLGDQYGVTLDSGQLQLELSDGEFRLRYYELDLPLNPRRLRMLLEHNLDALQRDVPADDPDLTEYQSVLFHLEHLPPYTATDAQQVAERQREKDVALARLSALLQRSARLRAHVDANIRRFNGTPGDSASFDLLHELLESQPYRLSSWRTATHEINYRRFFDINELAGIRMEEAAVFDAAHALLARLIADGTVTGVRLDHVDGLYDPDRYLHQLAALGRPGQSLWTVVEKILAPGESLSADWMVHGTTGYDFLNSVNGLFIDPSHAATFATLYAAFVGPQPPFADVEYESKKVIITSSMASELNVLAHELNRISESRRHFRDYTLDSLQEALREVVACFPVYRSYYRGGAPTSFDSDSVDRATRSALRRNPALEPTIFEFVRQMLLPLPDSSVTGGEHARRQRFAMKFQQYTAPVHAKGMEDTAFYRSNPLASLNEVGGDPTRFGRLPDAFHAENAARRERWPLSLLASTTHDTKRGEDARARINVLSEIPRSWRTVLGRWSRINRPARGTVHDRAAPSPNEEYLFYQALLGAWPPGSHDGPQQQFVQRMGAYMLKAIREAKVHTSWAHPVAEYEAAVLHFVHETLSGGVADRFLHSFTPFAERIARLGMINSLAQVVLKMSAPGVPDVYAGSELWELSLVDPDNRRAVDFAVRRRLLGELSPLMSRAALGDSSVVSDVMNLLDSWTDGRLKMYVTHASLALRVREPLLFTEGSYVPISATGERAEHVVAFARTLGGTACVTLVPRLVATLAGSSDRHPLGARTWRDTMLTVPSAIPSGNYRNVLTGETMALSGMVAVAGALTTLPVGFWSGPTTA